MQRKEDHLRARNELVSVYELPDTLKKLSFPHVKHVGLHSLVEWKPSVEPSERFRTSRNDKQTTKMPTFWTDSLQRQRMVRMSVIMMLTFLS